jgi:peptidoglycan/LPS O-acetylase OafA/YrhL
MSISDPKGAPVAPATENLGRITFLDFLRIFAFLSVLIGHKYYDNLISLANDQSIHASLRSILSLSAPFFYGGGAGVVVFFLVSGYIISHVLQSENVQEFLVKRAARIYPLFIFAVLLQTALLWSAGTKIPLSVIGPQLLLVGDLFFTPYALNGVEWTLRIEALFYLIMAALAYFKFMSIYRPFLPYVFFAISLSCYALAPIPGAEIWSRGYVTIYMPFLFIGAMFYLLEHGVIKFRLFLLFVGFVFCQYFMMIGLYQQRWINAHFALLAFLLFFAAWRWRRHFILDRWSLMLSGMTYAVYLFHAWLLDDLRNFLSHVTSNSSMIELLALVGVFVFSYASMTCIERPGIAVGRKASQLLLSNRDGNDPATFQKAQNYYNEATVSLSKWLASIKRPR